MPPNSLQLDCMHWLAATSSNLGNDISPLAVFASARPITFPTMITGVLAVNWVGDVLDIMTASEHAATAQSGGPISASSSDNIRAKVPPMPTTLFFRANGFVSSALRVIHPS